MRFRRGDNERAMSECLPKPYRIACFLTVPWPITVSFDALGKRP